LHEIIFSLNKQLQAAIKHLSEKDEIMASIINQVGSCGITRRKNYYKALVHSIMAQQISVKASQSIAKKFYQLIGQKLKPSNVLKFSIEELRTVGLSIQKATYIRDLSEKFAQNENIYNHLGQYSDEEAIMKLTEVKGIGLWTAQMFLIFSLGRLDILPLDDVGFQNAFQKYYKMKKRPSPKYLERMSKKWSPYRSVAVWYLWEAFDRTIM
jgi:DNA-3-methyladenine glycosylase II